MPEYEFTLNFNLPDAQSNPEDYLESLATVGCDDALIGIGKRGQIALNFIRESSSAKEAVYSAIAQVVLAIPQAVFLEVSPDFISLTEVAKLLGCTRQNIRNLIVSLEHKSPVPVYNGPPSIWHLADILSGLSQEKNYRIDPVLLELAKVNKDLNIAREWQRVDSAQKLELESLFTETCA
jgi:hypothetical protein